MAIMMVPHLRATTMMRKDILLILVRLRPFKLVMECRKTGNLTRVMPHLHLLNHTWVLMVNMVPLLFKASHTLSLWTNISNRPTTHHRTHLNTIELVTQFQSSSLCQSMNCTLFTPRMRNIHNLHTNPADNHGACNNRLPNIRNIRLGGRQLRIRGSTYLHPFRFRTNSNLFPISHIRTKCSLFPITHDDRSLLPNTQGVALLAVLQASRFPSTTQGSIIRPAPHRLHQ